MFITVMNPLPSIAIATCLTIISTVAIAMPHERLNQATIADRLQTLPGWTTDGQHLSCTYEFANFVDAIAFVNQLVEPSESAAHHPDLWISYNRVTVQLTTHDAGGLTALDFDVAARIATISDRTCR